MNVYLKGLLTVSLCSVVTINSFAVGAFCNTVNRQTGQHFTANGQAHRPGKAVQIARQKAMWQCHRFSRGWPRFCVVKGCRTY
jgi:hypothetical protein